MGKFKKQNVQKETELKNSKVNKKSKALQEKVAGGKNGVSKVTPKENSVKLPAAIIKGVKKQKNKKGLMENGNLEVVVTEKVPKHNPKAAGTGLQSGDHKVKNKELKSAQAQNGTKSNIPIGKPKNKVKEKAGAENILKEQSGPVPRLPLPPSTQEDKVKKTKGNKQVYQEKGAEIAVKGKDKIPSGGSQEKQKSAQKESEVPPKPATENQTKNVSKAQKQKRVPGELKAETKKVSKVVNASLQQKLKQKKIKNKKNKTQYKDPENMNIIPFDEEKFNAIVKEENIVKIVEALKTKVAEEVSQQKNQIFSDYTYVLNVTCYKIPMCPKRMVKLKVKHSLISDDDDVLLIVKDLKRGMRVDYEPTIHHYEDLLRAEGVKGIKAIMPFNQLKKEYGSYEMKTKLSNLYDYFVCDGSIVGHAVAILGKRFQRSRCAPYAVRMNTKNPAREIEKALHKTSYKQGKKGTMISVPVAHHKMPANQIAENIVKVISQLKTLYPGGLANIRNMYIRVSLKGTSALPLYMSLASPPEDVPYIIGPKEAKINKLKDEANKILQKFNITPGGGITRKRVMKNVKAAVEEEPKNKKKKAATKLAKNVEGKNEEQIEEDVKEESKQQMTNSKIAKEKINKKQVETQAAQGSKKDSDEEDSDDEEGSDQDLSSEDDDSVDDDE